jgi:hypothetical protein
MATTVVILQPCYFPWAGLFEQIVNADTYVHYDDVQFSRGSFTNRVQVKTGTGAVKGRDGVVWMTVPVQHSGPRAINRTPIDYGKPWRRKHSQLLRQTMSGAPFAKDALELFDAVVSQEWESIAALTMAGIEAVAEYFGIKTRFYRSSQLDIGASSTERVIDICKHFGADVYVTGLGAKNYIDHERFERTNIRLEYMDYKRSPYPQLHGGFTPYVTILDLIANCGKDGARYLSSGTRHWREVIPGVGADAGPDEREGGDP